MGANSNTSVGKRFFKLIAKAEKGNTSTKQVICEQVKQGEKWVVGGWYSSLSGYITAINIKEIEYQGAKSKIICLELTDSTGVCQLDFSFSGASYSIINSLLSADFTKEMEVSAWIKDGKYVNCGVKYTNGGKADWKLSIADQPKPIEYATPSGKMEKDFTNVKKFWENALDSIKGKATKSNFGGVIQAPKPIEQEKTSFIDDGDILPF